MTDQELDTKNREITKAMERRELQKREMMGLFVDLYAKQVSSAPATLRKLNVLQRNLGMGSAEWNRISKAAGEVAEQRGMIPSQKKQFACLEK